MGDVGRPGEAEVDFFISYTGAGTAWAEWIADTLEHAGYTTVLQAWDFRPGWHCEWALPVSRQRGVR
jgi:TIR domain